MRNLSIARINGCLTCICNNRGDGEARPEAAKTKMSEVADEWEEPNPTSGDLALERARSENLGPRPAASGNNPLREMDAKKKVPAEHKDRNHIQKRLYPKQLMSAVSRSLDISDKGSVRRSLLEGTAGVAADVDEADREDDESVASLRVHFEKLALEGAVRITASTAVVPQQSSHRASRRGSGQVAESCLPEPSRF